VTRNAIRPLLRLFGLFLPWRRAGCVGSGRIGCPRGDFERGLVSARGSSPELLCVWLRRGEVDDSGHVHAFSGIIETRVLGADHAAQSADRVCGRFRRGCSAVQRRRWGKVAHGAEDVWERRCAMQTEGSGMEEGEERDLSGSKGSQAAIIFARHCAVLFVPRSKRPMRPSTAREQAGKNGSCVFGRPQVRRTAVGTAWWGGWAFANGPPSYSSSHELGWRRQRRMRAEPSNRGLEWSVCWHPSIWDSDRPQRPRRWFVRPRSAKSGASPYFSTNRGAARKGCAVCVGVPRQAGDCFPSSPARSSPFPAHAVGDSAGPPCAWTTALRNRRGRAII